MTVLTMREATRFRLDSGRLAADLIERGVEPCGFDSRHQGGFAAAVAARFAEAWEAGAILAPPEVRAVLYRLDSSAMILALRETELPPTVRWPLRQVATVSFDVDEVACFGDESFGECCSAPARVAAARRIAAASAGRDVRRRGSRRLRLSAPAGCGSGARESRTLRVRAGANAPAAGGSPQEEVPMIVPRCPDCLSPAIEPDPHSDTGRWRCDNCGERFDLETAFIQLREAEDFRSEMESEPMFHLHRDLAEMELRVPDGALRALNPYSDVEELHRVLDAATASGAIEPRRAGAALHAYLHPGAQQHPVLGVDPGLGAELIGPELALRPAPGEDPISYTLRWLAQIVGAANNLLAAHLHGASGSRPDGCPRDEGPRSHRPASGRSPHRRYTAAAYWLHPDAPMSEKISAEGLSIAGVLAEVGERTEAGGLDAKASALGVSVFWEDGTPGPEMAR
jgi:hypothetical protein